MDKIEKLFTDKSLKLTKQRKLIAQIVLESSDHPDAETIFQRASKKNKHIGLATVYRTLKILLEANIIKKHEFRNGKAHFESISSNRHDHLIDLKTGKVIEFSNDKIEKLQEEIAKQLGYKLVDSSLELYAIPINEDQSTFKD